MVGDLQPNEFATTTHQDYHKKQSEACNILQSKQKVQRRKREVNVQGFIRTAEASGSSEGTLSLNF